MDPDGPNVIRVVPSTGKREPEERMGERPREKGANHHRLGEWKGVRSQGNKPPDTGRGWTVHPPTHTQPPGKDEALLASWLYPNETHFRCCPVRNMCGFKSLSTWSFVTAPTENKPDAEKEWSSSFQ